MEVAKDHQDVDEDVEVAAALCSAWLTGFFQLGFISPFPVTIGFPFLFFPIPHWRH